MRVAFINRKYTPFGGVERYLALVTQRLAERGHEVHIFASEWADAPSLPSSVVVHHVPIVPGPSWVQLWHFSRAVGRRLQKFQFDIVQSFDRTVSQDIYRAGGGCHREYLHWKRVSATGFFRRLSPYGSFNPRHWVTLAIEREICSKTPVIVALSERNKAEFIRHYGTPPGRIRLIRNGVDLERFCPDIRSAYRADTRAFHQVSGDQLLVLFVGSGFERKGVKTLIEALAALDSMEWAGIDFRLLIAGRDNPAPYFRLAEQLGIAEKISFLGAVKETPPLYAAADIFVLPSMYEPFGNACLEAMASGLPVVTTITTGVSEILAGREAGVVVQNPLDPRELARALAPFADAALRSAAGHQARLAAEEHPIDQKIEQFLELYDEFLQARSQKPG